MQVNYLCTKHADWIWNHPEQAMHFLAKDEFSGIMLYEDGLFREAVAYLGCAFDITAILHELEDGENPMIEKKLLSLSELIASAYDAMGLKDYRQAIERRVTALLRPHSVVDLAS